MTVTPAPAAPPSMAEPILQRQRPRPRSCCLAARPAGTGGERAGFPVGGTGFNPSLPCPGPDFLLQPSKCLTWAAGRPALPLVSPPLLTGQGRLPSPRGQPAESTVGAQACLPLPLRSTEPRLGFPGALPGSISPPCSPSGGCSAAAGLWCPGDHSAELEGGVLVPLTAECGVWPLEAAGREV